MLILTGLAVLLRLIVVWELRHTRAVADPPPGTDMRTYRNLAAAIAEGRWPDEFYYQPFYYSIFLPFARLLFGPSALSTGLLQAFLGGATVWLVGWTGRRLFSARAGLLAAAGLTLARFHIFYTPFALMAVLQAFWLAALVATGAWLEDRARWWQWALLGLLFGCANLTRGNMVILLPGILGFALWRHWRQWRLLALHGTIFLAVSLLLQLPFSWYNLQQTGRWTGSSTAAGAVLALSNSPESPPGGLAYTPTYETWMAMANHQEGRPDTSVPTLALDWIRREPLAWLELKWQTFLLFWSHQEIPNNVYLAVDGAPSRLLGLPILIDFWLLAALGLGGMMLSLRSPGKRRRPLVFAAAMVVLYCAATVFFYVLARFRLPAVPLLCLFAGYAGHRLWGELAAYRHRPGAKQRHRVLGLVLCLLLPLLFVIHGFPHYQRHWQARVLRVARPHGVLGFDGDNLLVYDHGPPFPGGWQLIEVPPDHDKVGIEKIFSLPPHPGLEERRPTRLRLPVHGQDATWLRATVEKQGRIIGVGQVEWTDAAADFQWLEIDLHFDQWRRRRSRLALQIHLTTDPVNPARTFVDTARDYRRTRIGTVREAGPNERAEGELCVQLVFEPQ